jgi:23S rRNA pseudouridine955/2504/2580 synthase
VTKPISISDIIVYEDDHVVALNKPAFLSTLDERDETKKSLLGIARQHWEGIKVCHRLDKETSGIILFAKTDDAYREMAIRFEHRKVTKWYHAIAEGRHQFEQLEIDKPLKINSKGYAKIDFREGKESLTIVNTLEIFRHYSLIQCYPFTGRLHQIRVHLKSQNAPLAADLQYGGSMPMLSDLKRKFSLAKDAEEQPIMNRVALHSHSLYFDLYGKNYELHAEYPKDFGIFLKLLRKYDQE